jgi:ribonuclease P protein component
MKTNNSFPKNERIVSQKLIDELFTSGQSHSLVAFPLRVVFFRDESRTTGTTRDESRTTGTTRDESRTTATTGTRIQVLISVSKRRFKHAVDRNRVKRQLREAYRLNRHLLSEHVTEGQQLRIAFIWLADYHLPSGQIADRMASLLKRIARKAQVAPSISATGCSDGR